MTQNNLKNTSITKYKDTDKLILKHLDYETLCNCMLINKYFYNLCDNNFFMNVVKLQYPETKQYHSVSQLINKTWKKYYISIIKYIRLLRLEFNVIYKTKYKNPEYLYKVRKLYLNDNIANGRNSQFVKMLAIRILIRQKNLTLVEYFIEFIPVRFIGALLPEACEINCFYLVKFLVERLEKKEIKKFKLGLNDALFSACRNGNFGIAKYLLELGSNVNYIYNTGQSILTICFVNGYFRLFKLLIDYGAILDLDFLNHPYPCASVNVNIDILKYLTYNGFNIHMNNYRLFREAMKSGNVECMKYLIERGADFNCRGYGAFAQICYDLRIENNLKAMKYCIELGVSKYEIEEAISYSNYLIKSKIEDQKLDYYNFLYSIIDYLQLSLKKKKYVRNY